MKKVQNGNCNIKKMQHEKVCIVAVKYGKSAQK